MMIQQLRSLERDGVVSRVLYPVVPPKIEYSLTTRGQGLCPALDELLAWAQQRKGQLVAGMIAESRRQGAKAAQDCAEPRF
jgi:DNA-binding HxlR family transcriptional regulator